MREIKNYPYEIKAFKYDDEEIEYQVNFKDFKEIIGLGDSIEEALEEAYDNLEAHIKYCEKNGIALPTVKYEESKEYSGKITVRIPKKLHKDISNLADMEGMSLNSIVIDALRSYTYDRPVKFLATHIDQLLKDYVVSMLSNKEFTIEYPNKEKGNSWKNYSISALDNSYNKIGA